MLEKCFWSKIRMGMGTRWRATRIEDRLNSGTPDLFFSVGALGGMMELKCQEPRKDGTILARHYTQDQRDFHLKHSPVVFFFLYSDGWYMLFNRNDAANGQTVEWHIENALYASKTPNWNAVIAHLVEALTPA